jgi:transcriptional regulator with XRE-family HTH domain
MAKKRSKIEPSSKRAKVGKTRHVPTGKPKTPRERFAARLRELLGDRPASFLADAVGVKPDAVLKWLRGANTPDLDYWPKLAKAFGLDDWRDLLPPV